MLHKIHLLILADRAVYVLCVSPAEGFVVFENFVANGDSE